MSKKIDKQTVMTIVKIGAFLITAAASIASGWVENETIKKEVADQVSAQIKNLPQ